MADWELPVNCKKCRDHLGHEYRSIREMTRAWKVTDFQYYKRLSRGWSLEKALTVPSGGSHPVRDHLGQEFCSVRDMAVAWNVGYDAYLARRKYGWSIERALTEPVRGRCRFPDPAGAGITDPYELSVATGVAPHTIYRRVRGGKSPAEIEFAGNLKRIPSRDHLGQDFPTLRKMAEYWQIEYQTLLARLKKGWDVEKALTAPLDRRGRKLGGKNVHATGGPQS